MSFIDTEFVYNVSVRLDKFTKKNENLYTFRCPYCGDSSKYKNKTRGYFYKKRSDLFFKCHNCGVGRTFSNFLKDLFPDMYDHYVMERYKSGLTGKASNTANPKLDFDKPKFKSKQDGVVPISNLNTTHPARQYLESRKVPEKYFDKLFYAEKYKTWVNTQKQTFKTTDPDHQRIIIPLTNNGEWFGFQGRALNPKNPLRYITTILDDSLPKIFNLDGIDFTKPVYITEGPFDSLFLDNAIAMVGADVDWEFIKSKSDTQFVFVYDNEPRNSQIVSRMEKVIASKHSIVIWPRDLKEKDINDMIVSGHSPQDIVQNNTFDGINAQLKFTEWKKV